METLLAKSLQQLQELHSVSAQTSPEDYLPLQMRTGERYI